MVAGLLTGWLLAGCCWLLAGSQEAIRSGEGLRMFPGAYSLQQQLLEAVRYEIYTLKVYKLRRLRKVVR